MSSTVNTVNMEFKESVWKGMIMESVSPRKESTAYQAGFYYSREDLKTLQSLPLREKIQKTQGKILEWCLRWNWNVYVSFSGGKDSTVLMDMVQRVADAFDRTVPGVFVDTGLEYPEIRGFVKTFGDRIVWLKPAKSFKKVLEDYGYPVVSKDVASAVAGARRGAPSSLRKFEGLNADGTPSPYVKAQYGKYKYLINAPFKISDSCCNELKKKPAKLYEKETGRKPIIAIMASESMRRRLVYMRHGCNAFNARRPISHPMGFWTEQDVLQYLRDFEIPYAPVYGKIVEGKNHILKMDALDRTGCIFCMFGVQSEKGLNRFQRLKQTHPKLHSYCMNRLGCGAVLDYMNVEH